MNAYKSQELNELFSALSKAQADIKVAIKDAANPFFKSKYANLQMVMEASRPALCKNNLSIIQQIITQDGHDYIITTLGHSSGQWISSYVRLNPSKPDVQSLGSYITYMRRYCYSSLVGVYDGEEDDDGNEASFATQEQIKTLQSYSAEIQNRILKYFNCKELKLLKNYEAQEAIESMSKSNKG